MITSMAMIWEKEYEYDLSGNLICEFDLINLTWEATQETCDEYRDAFLLGQVKKTKCPDNIERDVIITCITIGFDNVQIEGKVKL